jgi:hypothetical protein
MIMGSFRGGSFLAYDAKPSIKLTRPQLDRLRKCASYDYGGEGPAEPLRFLKDNGLVHIVGKPGDQYGRMIYRLTQAGEALLAEYGGVDRTVTGGGDQRSFRLACDGADDQPRGQPGNAGQFASAGSAGSGKAKSLKGKAKAEPGAPKGATGRAIKAVEDFVKGKLSPADFAELQRIMREAGKTQPKARKDRTPSENTSKLGDALEAAINGENGSKFWALYEQAKKLPAKEAINLAHKMTGAKVRTKDDALFQIQRRQRESEINVAKRKATAGRTAA